MNSKKRIEGNKLIAAFLEIPVREYIDKRGKPIGLMITDEEGELDHKYGIDWFWPCSNWNDLMQAITKLDLLAEKKEVKWTKEYEEMCDNLDNSVTTYQIITAWKAVILFIEWYNLNKLA